MSERYKRLYTLSGESYAEASPVTVAAGALLLDNERGSVLAQLKFRSLSTKVIKALTVEISPWDVAGAELDKLNHRYLDLNARRGEEFCQKLPVPLPDSGTRSFTVKVTEAVFDDNSVWRADDAPWELLPQKVPFTAELLDQYRLEYGDNSTYAYKEYKDLWYCACGELNKTSETMCCSCQKHAEKLKAVKLSELKAHMEERKAKEELAAKKRKKITSIVTAAAILCIAAIIIITKVIIPNNYYNNANIGDYIYFGAYEQDNNTSNGKEKIEWLVLDKQDGKLLVISKYALDYQKYHASNTDVTWESCSLRYWLNSTFIDNAFSAEEQAMIQTSTVSVDTFPQCSTDPGEATQDKVFLLSLSEVNNYFKSKDARICGATDYAKAQGADTSNRYSADGKASCSWWLRSPGSYQTCAANVHSDSMIDYCGAIYSYGHAVRPALWITLK